MNSAAGSTRRRSSSASARVDGAVGILLDVIDAMDMRIIALEPCPAAPKAYNDKGHTWDDDRCMWCQAKRVT